MGAPDLAMPRPRGVSCSSSESSPRRSLYFTAERVKRTVGRPAITPYPRASSLLRPFQKQYNRGKVTASNQTTQSSERQVMPTVLKIGPHRFYFFSKEGQEPAHIHVETAENAAKFWLSPVELAWAAGYNSKELRKVRELVEERALFFLEKWHEHFRTQSNND